MTIKCMALLLKEPIDLGVDRELFRKVKLTMYNLRVKVYNNLIFICGSAK